MTKSSLVNVTTGLLLWGVFFLELALPLALGLLLSASLIYVSIAKNLELDTIGMVLLGSIFYWIASAFAVDALDLSSFLNPRFYGGEGRIFISLMPLVALCFVAVGSRELLSTIRNLQLIAAAGLGLYLIWMVTGTSLLSGPGHSNEFHGFLSSHTGAGTFFGALAVFFIVFNAEKKSPILLLLSLLLLLPSLATASREAMVGSMAALAWYWGLKRRRPAVLIAVALGGLLLLLPLLGTMSDKTYNRTIGILDWSTIEGIGSQAKAGIRSDWVVGDWTAESSAENLQSGDVTTLVRIMLWVYASKRFVDSPLFGMGWGRFNDEDLFMLDGPPLLSVAAEGKKVFSTTSAHNSYFHLLAESGLIGITLYLAMWIMLYRRCAKAEDLFHPVRSVAAYYVACQGLIIYILVCGLTGHALASPSVMVPVVTIVGVGIAYYRTAVKCGAAQRNRISDR